MSIGKALIDLADIATCVSNDFHLIHLNFIGEDFDTMHKKVLQKYYTNASEDADTWYEAAAIFDEQSLNQNESAERIKWQSCSGTFTRHAAVKKIDELLTAYCDALTVVFRVLNKGEDYKSIGVANTVQTQIEYWCKELCYFNKRRDLI